MYTFSIIYFIHTIWAYLKGINYTYETITSFCLSLFIGLVFNLSLGLGIKSITRKKPLFLISMGLSTLLLVIFLRYRYRFGSSANLAVFFDNFELLLNSEGLKTAGGKLKGKDYLIAVIVSIVSTAITFFTYKPIRKKLISLVSIPISVGFIIIYPIQNDEGLNVIRSAYQYVFPKNFKSNQYAKFIQNGPRKVLIDSSFKKRPNVIIILLESFSSSYIGHRTARGEEITPTMNKLKNSSLWLDHYYSPTIQTVKAQYSILCSKIPLIKGKASYQLSQIRFECLPKIARQLDYETFFYKSYQDMTFDNTDKFAKHIGFQHIEVAPLSRLSASEKKANVWGWGVQDDISYKMFLDRFDELKANSPVFAVMTTVTHHMNFNKIPQDKMYLFSHPKNKQERFQNSLFLSDKYLETFLEEIKKRGIHKNTLIFITADHSYPSGEHGNYNSELGAYEENFKVPMAIIGQAEHLPKIKTNLTYSHYDLMPTIAEAIGYNGEIESVGGSMYSKKENLIIPLIQPYDGLKISFISYPTKYTWSADRDEVKKFDLTAGENLIETKKGRKSVQQLIDFTYAELELVY
jgi:phosphoglycerol transferase MdoB-like AlkP superfamily enzyme